MSARKDFAKPHSLSSLTLREQMEIYSYCVDIQRTREEGEALRHIIAAMDLETPTTQTLNEAGNLLSQHITDGFELAMNGVGTLTHKTDGPHGPCFVFSAMNKGVKSAPASPAV